MDPIIPKDIPLPLPAPFWLLEVLLLVSFAAHILFVALMLGGSITALFAEIRGLRNKDWDTIALEIAKTITVNKSVAVVLGVAPLLTINVLYTVQFYAATILTANVWLLIIPLAIVAFLLLYIHKYSWHILENNKALHISILALATAIFLFIPTIFLANINLMLYPEWWSSVKGFVDAVFLPNVLPRYLHFLTATIAVTGLFLVKYMGRTEYYEKLGLTTVSRDELVRGFYGMALGATGIQFFFGPMLFLTLPAHVISMTLLWLLLVVVILAAVSVWWLWQEYTSDEPGGRFWHIVGVISTIVTLMVIARHDIRETALVPHREAVAQRTQEYMQNVLEAQDFLVMPGGLGGAPLSPGAKLFKRKCASCHALERRLVGPPLAETASLYKGNPDGIVDWALKPGKRRADYPQMPAQEIPRDDLKLIADFILETTAGM
jgi:cytochrome c